MKPVKKIKFIASRRGLAHKIPTESSGHSETYIRTFGKINGLKPSTYKIGDKVVVL